MNMLKVLVFFCIVLGCNGMTETTKMIEEDKMDSTLDTTKLNYLALGDSYTIGESVSEQERFPYQLLHSEFENEYELGELKIIARTGWTTRDLLAAIDKESLVEGQFDFITLLIGVNNQYQGKPFSQFENEFNILIDRAITLLNGNASKVVVVSIPDYSVTPFAAGGDTEKIALEIEKYNDYKEEVAKEKGARYVFITDLTQNAKNDASLLADDKLHPSGKSYGQWVARILPEVNLILSE